MGDIKFTTDYEMFSFIKNAYFSINKPFGSLVIQIGKEQESKIDSFYLLRYLRKILIKKIFERYIVRYAPTGWVKHISKPSW